MVVRAEDNDGEAALGVLDPERVIRSLRDRLCGICGRSLGYWIAFVGGGLCLTNRLYLCPLHEDCARYAMRVCPFLASPQAKYRPLKSDIQVQVNPLMADRRPAEMFLVITRRYEPVVVGDEPLAKIGPPVRVERF